MTSSPALLLILGAAVVALLPQRSRGALSVALPAAGLVLLWVLPEGSAGTFEMFGLALDPVRVDGLSRVFASAFLIAAMLVMVYALHLPDPVQQAAVLTYAGSAVGGALAGDLLTLFVFWELTGLTSVFLIWSRRTERGYRAGMRYLVAQVVSGLLMLGGIVLRVTDGHGLAFDHLGLGEASGWLILVAIGLKCAFPVLHAWLTDTYPEATIVGTVALSAFTTKLAVYTLARGFEGVELLVWVGAVMTVFPIFYAVIENDLRRVLAYSLINQLGFMVVGVGIGGELGINGAAAHAFAHIMYKSLLFMSMGAVLLRTGTVKGSDLGGLYKSMPQTMVLCVIGAASISAVPLFSGFAAKSLIMEAAGQEHLLVVWLVLLFASAGVFHHAGIKVPYFAFFAHDRGYRVEEAPVSMRVAMTGAAVVCLGAGIFPGLLYGILPFPVDYTVYTAPHVVTQLQLLLFAALAFTVLVRTGLYPPELRSVNLDADVVYRKVLPSGARAVARGGTLVEERAGVPVRQRVSRWWARLAHAVRTDPRVAHAWPSHLAVWWVALVFGLVLLVALL